MKREVFVVWFGIFLVWAIYRAYVVTPEWIDELVAKPLVFFLPVIWITRFVEKNRLQTLGFNARPRDIFVDTYLGVVIGILFAFEGLFANYFKYGEFSFTPIVAVTASSGIVSFLLINLATSVWEEVLGRGYMYQRLFAATNNQLWSAISSSFLFLLLHVPIMFTRLHLTGSSFLIYPISIFLLGVANCYLFSLRKSLTLPILVHLFWNMTVALYL